MHSLTGISLHTAVAAAGNLITFGRQTMLHDTLWQEEFWHVVKLVVVFGFVLGILKLRQGTRKERTRDVEDTKMIQELYQGFERMEERVESLETLLLDKNKKDKGST